MFAGAFVGVGVAAAAAAAAVGVVVGVRFHRCHAFLLSSSRCTGSRGGVDDRRRDPRRIQDRPLVPPEAGAHRQVQQEAQGIMRTFTLYSAALGLSRYIPFVVPRFDLRSGKEVEELHESGDVLSLVVLFLPISTLQLYGDVHGLKRLQVMTLRDGRRVN